MAVIFQGVGAAAALSSSLSNSFDSKKFVFSPRRFFSVKKESSFAVVGSNASVYLNPRGRMAQQLISNAVATKADGAAASSSSFSKTGLKSRALSSLQQFPPNAFNRKNHPQWRGGFSLGVDLGSSRTGLALSKGFSVRPLTVLKLRGQKLELELLDMAEREEADELIIGLPISWDGKETPQSNKVRSIAGRLAVQAAHRGWRVYLQDEHGTSSEASYRMINMGLDKSARQKSSDAYAAVILLERYFAMSGEGVEIVLPKQLDLQEKLRRGTPPQDIDF